MTSDTDILSRVSISDEETNDKLSYPKRKIWGLTVLGLTSGAVVALVAAAAPFVAPALRRYCLPFVPATDEQVKNVLTVLPKRGKVADIGSGDGRITICGQFVPVTPGTGKKWVYENVLAAAERGLMATGYELNPWLVLYSKFKSYRLGMKHRTTFVKRDLWKTDFEEYNYVVIFGVTQMMPRLEEKLSKELRTGSHVVACRFPFPTWQPVRTIGHGIDTVWLYNVPQSFKA